MYKLNDDLQVDCHVTYSANESTTGSRKGHLVIYDLVLFGVLAIM